MIFIKHYFTKKKTVGLKVINMPVLYYIFFLLNLIEILKVKTKLEDYLRYLLHDSDMWIFFLSLSMRLVVVSLTIK